jgi:subtilisin family serine protease
MKKILLLAATLPIFLAELNAQHTRHIVYLKDKGNASFSFSSPLAFLSQRAIDRRLRYNIPVDSTDLPVTPAYIQQIDNIPNVTILNASRWLNALTIQTSDAGALSAIAGLPFVVEVSDIAARPAGRNRTRDKNRDTREFRERPEITGRTTANYFNYGTQSFNEIHLHNGEFLHNIGMRGQGMQIGMLDNGFFNYPNLRAFDSARIAGQILGTWNFVTGQSNVTNAGSHGMQCLSTIAANIPGQFVGKAPKASFWLYKTEDDLSEFPIEEFNWVCGAERSDSSGADIISSSLGYYDFDDPAFNYSYNDMNGNTTIAARGADRAARKGLLVFNAAGNEGNNAWRFIITPADGDSVVAVGAVNTAGAVGSFSSYGPSSDGQVKPDVASVGVAALVQTTSNTVGTSNGTSFACPNMAGLGACLWQAFPEYNNMQIVYALRAAGHKALNPDDRVGYGIPNMKTAFSLLLADFATTMTSTNGCRVTLNWISKDVGAMKYEIEKKEPGQSFVKVGELNPIPGEILAPHNYSFSHDLTSGSSGTYQFRIRQVIDTSTTGFAAVYIDTAAVNLTTPCVVTGLPPVDPSVLKIYLGPNPTDAPLVNLFIESPGAVAKLTVRIFDEKGGLLRQFTDSKGSGKKIIPVQIATLPAGVYYFQVLDGNQLMGTAELVRL